MNIEDYISDQFIQNDWSWKLKGKGRVIPTSSDVQTVLDEAAKMLYSEPVGAQLEVGRLIIKKLHTGHDVYILAGQYE